MINPTNRRLLGVSAANWMHYQACAIARFIEGYLIRKGDKPGDASGSFAAIEAAAESIAGLPPALAREQLIADAVYVGLTWVLRSGNQTPVAANVSTISGYLFGSEEPSEEDMQNAVNGIIAASLAGGVGVGVVQ